MIDRLIRHSSVIVRAAWSDGLLSKHEDTVAADDPSYDYADLSQIRFSYVMFQHSSTIDRLAASGHRFLSSRASIACDLHARKVGSLSW